MDCLQGMEQMPDVDCIVTDIPYDVVNRESNGLRNLDKEAADVATFNLEDLTKLICSKTKGSVYMFCGSEQLSTIRATMVKEGLTTRVIVWEKTNPSPMNGQYMWLSGVELCVYGKKKGATFNLHCKNTVLRHPCGKHDIHPTQKPIPLMKELILASTNEGDVVCDPFMGSATTAMACIQTNRNYIGFELNEEYYRKSLDRIQRELSQPSLNFIND